MTAPTREQATAAFESWFRSEMAEYEGDGDMTRALLRAKENIRWGWVEGYAAARAQALDEAAMSARTLGIDGIPIHGDDIVAVWLEALKGKQ